MKTKTIRVVIMAFALITLVLFSFANAFADIPEASDVFYVADYADVISSDTEDYIVEKNIELENLSGAQIVVVTVDFLDGMDIEDYLYKLFNNWQIGDKEKNNGVLLLLAIGEDNYWCMQGKGLERILTSGDIDEFLWDYLEPDFAVEEYDKGVRSVFDAFYNYLNDYYAGSAGSGNSYSPGETTVNTFGAFIKKLFIIFAVILLLIVIGSVIVARKAARNVKPPITNGGNGSGDMRGQTYGGSGSNPWNPVSPKPQTYYPRPRANVFPLSGWNSRKPGGWSGHPYNNRSNSGSSIFGSSSSSRSGHSSRSSFGGSSHHSSFGGSSHHSSFGGSSHHSSFGGGRSSGGGGMSRGGGAGRRR